MTAGVELPLRAIREQISSAFDLLVQISRLVDGSRRITHITEVLRMESDVITLQDVFIAKPPDEDEAPEPGKPVNLLNPLACTGLKPQFLEKMAANGVVLPPYFFGDELELPAELRSRELRRVRVSRRASRLLVAAVVAALVDAGRGRRLAEPARDRHERLPDGARHRRRAGRQVAAPPTLTENGNQVVGLARRQPRRDEERRDRDRPLALDGRGASSRTPSPPPARSCARRPPSDQVSVVAFGSKAVQLTPFSQSTADADDALRLLKVDTQERHRALRRARSSRPPRSAARPAARGSSSCSPTARTSRARPRCRTRSRRAHDTGTLVYPIAIGGDSATVAPLKQMAAVTGGSFKTAATSSSLNAVYSSIAGELKRTWRVEYVTAARPGEQLHLRVAHEPRRRGLDRPARSPAPRRRTPAAARCRARSTRRSAGCC